MDKQEREVSHCRVKMQREETIAGPKTSEVLEDALDAGN